MSHSELVARCSAPPSTNITGCALEGETVVYTGSDGAPKRTFERTVLSCKYVYSVPTDPKDTGWAPKRFGELRPHLHSIGLTPTVCPGRAASAAR